MTLLVWPALVALSLAAPPATPRLPQRAELRAAHPRELDLLGDGVAVSGGAIVATAPTHMSHGRVIEGKGLVSVKPWAGVRHQAATLRPPRSAAYDGFGESVAMAGDTVVVGAGGSGLDSDRSPGRAYVFVKPRGGWHGTVAPSATLRASGAAAGDPVGYAVAISGRPIAGGAPGPHRCRGGAYVFVKPAAGWRGVRRQAATLAGGR